MTPKRPRLFVPDAPAATLPASSTSNLLTLLEAEQPTGTLLLADISPHPSPSRPLTAQHVIALAHSIAALGLIHPLAVDRHGVVIAGSHRYAALRLLASADRATMLVSLCTMSKVDAESLPAAAEALPLVPPELVESIPIRRLPLSLVDDPEGAWRVEVAENESRRDYVPREVRALADHLKAKGYRIDQGRPRKGEQAGMPLLATIIGKSERHVRRLLTEVEADEEKRTDVRNTAEKNRQAAVKALTRYKTQHATEMTDDQQSVLEKALRVLDALAQ